MEHRHGTAEEGRPAGLREAGCDLERSGPDDRLGYYLDEPEPIGRWLGGGAEALGLIGPLTPTGATLLREFLEGRGLDGQRQLPPVYRYTPDGTRLNVRRCGFDVTLSSPKSVSVLMGLADPAIAAQADTDGLTLLLRDGRDITLDRGWLTAGTLDYGYALTLHKAQGRTVQTALLWGDPSLYQQAGYVGLSRGRAANHLYLAPSHDHNDDLGCWPHTRPRPDPADRGSGLAASRAHELALHQLPRDTSRGRSR